MYLRHSILDMMMMMIMMMMTTNIIDDIFRSCWRSYWQHTDMELMNQRC